MTRSRRFASAAVAGLCVLSLGVVRSAAADERPARGNDNSVYVELGGSGLATINYDRLLSARAGLRVGVGAVPLVSAVDLVVMPHVVLGDARNRFEAGVGILVLSSAFLNEALVTGEIACRFNTRSGFLLGVSLAAIDFEGRIVAVPGISMGLRF